VNNYATTPNSDVEFSRADNDSANRTIALWEIISIVISIEIAEWVVLALGPRNKLLLAIPCLAAISLVLFSKRQRSESWADLGWRMDNFWTAFQSILLPTAIGAVFILVGGWCLSSFHFSRTNLFTWALGLPVWAFAQQFILQSFVNRRAQIAFGSGMRSVLIVAIIFMVFHLPNPLLMISTFIGGAIWARAFQRHPNLFVVALSHAFLSFLLALSLPNWLLNNLRVGFKYLA